MHSLKWLRRLRQPGLQVLVGVRPLSAASTSATEVTKSALYITNKLANSLEAVVEPDLDFEAHLSHSDFQRHLEARQFRHPSGDGIEVSSLLSGVKLLKWIMAEKSRLEADRLALGTASSSESNISPKDREKQSKILQKSIRDLASQHFQLEQSVVYDLLLLPNKLSLKTPLHHDRCVREPVHPPSGDLCPSHANSSQLEFSSNSPTAFYLHDDLAMLELTLMEKVERFFVDAQAILMACPDFVRSSVLEGCYPMAFLHPDEHLALEETSDIGSMQSALGVHLVGGASLPAFISFFVKNVIMMPELLPVVYLSLGRLYRNVALDQATKSGGSLFDTLQSTAAGLHCVCKDADSLDTTFDSLTDLLCRFYDSLDLTYRVMECCAPKLELAQSYCLSYQVYSPSQQSFIPVGHLAKYDDFISKRLMLKYCLDQKSALSQRQYDNLHIASGVAVDITKLLGCIIEQKKLA